MNSSIIFTGGILGICVTYGSIQNWYQCICSFSSNFPGVFGRDHFIHLQSFGLVCMHVLRILFTKSLLVLHIIIFIEWESVCWDIWHFKNKKTHIWISRNFIYPTRKAGHDQCIFRFRIHFSFLKQLPIEFSIASEITRI